MIRWNNKKVIPYYKDYKPANVYKGSSAVALAKRMTGSGAVNEFRTEYKSTPIKRIVGQSVQESGTKKAAHVMGKTSKWNQLANFYWLTENKQWESEKVNFSNHKATITFTNNETERIYWYLDIANPIATVQGHKYAVYLDIGVSNAVLASKSINYQFRINGTYSRIGSIDFEKKISIWESQGQEIDRASCYQENGIRNTITPNSKFEVSFSMVDITSIFGSGNEPTSTDDTRIQSLIAYAKSHPEYDEGSLKSVVLNDVTYVGEDVFQKYVVDRKYINRSGVEVENVSWQYAKQIPVKPNTTYKCLFTLGSQPSAVFYDKNKSLISIMEGDNANHYSLTTPNSCYFVSISNTKEYLSYFYNNGQTIPFSTPVILNGLATQDEIYSYVDGNELVTKKVKRYGKYTFTGNEQWQAGYGEAYGATIVTNHKRPQYDDTSILMICSVAERTNYNNIYYNRAPNSIGFNRWGQMIIGSGLYANKSILTGATLVYELATPTITEISRVPLTCDFDDVTNIIVSNENAGLADPDTSYSMDPFPTPYIPSDVVSSSKIDIQHNNHYYEINGLTEKWNQLLKGASFESISTDTREGLQIQIQQQGSPSYVEVTIYNTMVAEYSTIFTARATAKYQLKHNGRTNDIFLERDISLNINHKYVFHTNVKANNPQVVGGIKLEDTAIIDLTDIFGSGSEPTSIDDPRIQRLIEIAKRRPQYDEGSLLSASKIYDKDDNFIYDLDEPIRSAGNIHDVLCTNGQVKVNMGDVDLGTLNWITDTVIQNRFVASFPYWYDRGVRRSIGSCSSFLRVIMDGSGYDAAANNVLYGTLGKIYVQTTEYQNPTAFKTAMQGVILIYELAGPTTQQAASMYLPAGLTFHDEYGRSLTSTYKEEILTDVIDIESSGIGTATDEIWVNRESSNLLDEEWELGDIAYATGNNLSSTTWIRSKNYCRIIEGVTYFLKTSNKLNIFFYDEEQNYLGLSEGLIRDKVQGTFATPANACYLRIAIKLTTYNHDIAIVEGTSGEYEPYAKGKVISIQRIGKVDLGTLGWQKTSGNLFYSIIDDVKQGVGTWGTVLGMCTKYVRNPISALTLLDKEFCIGSLAIESSGKNIAIREDSQSDPTTFKQSLSGTILYYELANPVITDITNTELGQKLLAKSYPNANHRISIDLGSIDVQWFEAK